MSPKTTCALVALAFVAAACASDGQSSEFQTSEDYYYAHPVELLTTETRNALVAPPMEAERKVSEQDCSRPFETGGGNLLCK